MNNGQHWRKCAEQARRHAGKFIAPEAKRAVLDLADSYELLAQRAAGRDTGVDKAISANASGEHAVSGEASVR